MQVSPPPPLVFHSAADVESAPTTTLTSTPRVNQPDYRKPGILSTPLPPQFQVQPSHPHPPPMTYTDQGSRHPHPHPTQQDVQGQIHPRHPSLPPNFYPRIREVRRPLQTVPEDKDGEEEEQTAQRIRERVLGHRRQIHNPLQEAKAAEQRHTDSFHHGRGRGGEVREAVAEVVDEGSASARTLQQDNAPRMSATDLSALTT